MARPNVLIVGGTGFLGSWVTRAAAAAGGAVTVLHRGRRSAELPEGVEVVHADRDGDLSVLANRRFDLVVDVAAYRPEQVARLLEALGDRFGHYVFVSSISAVDLSRPGVTEQAPGVRPVHPDRPDYGEAKALCEQLVVALGGRGLVVRPGLIGGPGDRTDRATWWGRRADQGGPRIAPGSPGDVLQLIDVRDLAPFLIRAGLAHEFGVLHAVGEPVPWGAFLHDLSARTDQRATWVWLDGDRLAAHELHAWTDLPMWVPPLGAFSGACRVDRTQAVVAGLWTRPPAETVLAAWAWRRDHPEEPGAAGISDAREAEILAAEAARAASGSPAPS